jgi:hypothetical protein
MSGPTPRVLVAGAGWRVSAFVIPALLSLGLPRNDITILRRRRIEPDSILAGIRMVNRIEELSGAYSLTINCVAAGALVNIQCQLLDRFPTAIHFCDTPIFRRWIELPAVIRLARVPNLFSLEDWPTMPNLRPMLQLCSRTPKTYQLRFEHVGIANHFLAATRAAATAAGLNEKRVISRAQQVLMVRSAKADAICVHTGPKDTTRAKIVAWNGNELIEDFFEVHDSCQAPGAISEEVIFRLTRRDRLRYFLGSKCFHEVEVPNAILELFLSRATRHAAHELDKCVSLMDVFGAALRGKTIGYGYVQSVKDTIGSFLARPSDLRSAYRLAARGLHFAR